MMPETSPKTPHAIPYAIRIATNADCESVIALIDRAYREYGDRIHLENADRDLANIEAAYLSGAFWVLDGADHTAGSVALQPHPGAPDVCLLKRLYLDHALRATGWGLALLERAVTAARERGYRQMHFWTDTRFTRAHTFYKKHGCTTDGTTRTLNDAWEPYEEYFFTKPL